jgi:PKD repeat protein
MARVLRVLAILSILILATIPSLVSAAAWNYTSPGTYYWNNTGNLTAITLDIIGGGGAGAAGYVQGGYGGHAGEYQRIPYIAINPYENYTLIVGSPGANNTVAGIRHDGNPSSAFGTAMPGGIGGFGTQPVVDTGEVGEAGQWNATYIAINGTSSTWPGGVAGIGYGAGGGGGGSDNFANTFNGGAGASGFIRIWEYGTATGNMPMFQASSTSEKPGSAIKFIDQSVIINTTALTYLWDFGDGGSSNTTGDVNHVYSYTGIYTVSLTISSDGGTTTETKKDYITITSVDYYDPNNPPKSVRFHIQTIWGMPLPGATVSALGITTSTGSWDWVVTLLGIPLDEVGINGTAMTDTTDSNGNIEFLMIPSAKYNVTTTLSGYSFPIFYVTPHDTQYNIIAALNGTGWFETGNDTLAQIKINVTSEKISDTVGRINISYYDAGGTTVSGAINITKDNTTRGGEPVLVESIPMTGSSGNYTTVVDIPQEGTAYKVSVNPNPYGTAGPDIKAIRDFAVWFKGEPIALAGFSPTILLWFSIFLLIFTAMFAGATHAPQMAIILCVEAWVLFSMGWLDPLETNYWVGQPVLVFTLGFATVMAIWWNLGEGKRKETGR